MVNISLREIFTSAVIMLLLDGVYLSSFKNYFDNVFKLIQGSNLKIRYSGVILCYLILVFGINYFIISKRQSLINAFLLGFVIYAVYETTNYATLDKWPLFMVILDSLWGGTLFALTTFITYKLYKIKHKLI